MNRADIEQKILKSIPKQKRVRLHLAPRFGKTKLMIQVIQRDDPQKILWVTPSRQLADNDIPAWFKTSTQKSDKFKRESFAHCHLIKA